MASFLSLQAASPVADRRVVEMDANHVFFSPCGRLVNVRGEGGKEDALNQFKSYDYTKGWTAASDTLVWGIDVQTPGELVVSPVLGVPEVQDGSVIELLLNGQHKEVVVASTGGYTTFKEQPSVSFRIDAPGRYRLQLKSVSQKQAGELAYVKGLKVASDAVQQLAPVALRWRPAAVHCNFSNRQHPEKIILAVHENTIATPWVDCYQPITTPFGYYGSTWDAEQQEFGGVNFSLWSFSNKQAPPVTQEFSHLIAVGRGLKIDGFNHEGTGAKARGRNPFEGKHARTQVLAVKKVPGNPYDVYYSYYWDDEAEKWMLYGCGKKYNDKPLEYLKTGAFVEQPGPAEVQRSNHVMRQVNFRGWLMDEKGQWYPIDELSPRGRLEKASFKNWGTTDTNLFFMQMGGFAPIAQTMPGAYYRAKDEELPLYLSAEKLKDLSELPAEIEMLEPKISRKKRNSDTHPVPCEVTLRFHLKKTGTNPHVKLYWGSRDGLTFVKGNKGGAGVVEWEHETQVAPDSKGNVQYTVTNYTEDALYYRLQVQNEEGETWSFDTGKVACKE